MENKKKMQSILIILIGISALLYSLVDLFLQVKAGYFPRITTIIVFLFAAILIYVFFSKEDKK